VELLGENDVARLVGSAVLASIGPITSRTMKEKGLSVDIEASEYTIDGLIDALVSCYTGSHTKS
jgi:uroporphyrinogen III methyltransferase/synthase